jgi:phage terminase small subunit
VPTSRKQKETGLSDKMERFCHEYVLDFNGTQAAIRAGYSKKTAKEQAAQNLTKLNIQNKIKDLINKRSTETEQSGAEVIRRLWELANINISDIMTIDEGGSVQAIPIDKLPPGTGRLISKIKEKRTIKEAADGSSQTMYGQLEYEVPDRRACLELLGKHYGIFMADKNNDIDVAKLTDEQLRDVVQGKKVKD